MAHRTQCLIFDFGNVLAWVNHRQACRRLAQLSSAALEEGAVYDLVFTSGLEARYDRGEISTAAFPAELQALLKLAAPLTTIAAVWSDVFTPNPAVLELIPGLVVAGYCLVLASNTNELHAQWFERQFAPTLQHFHWQILSHQVHARKPERRFFQQCLSAAACSADRCLYVDDRADFVAAAAEQGIGGIVYQPEVDLEDLLRARGICW